MVPACKVQVTKMEKNDHIMGRSFFKGATIIIKTVNFYSIEDLISQPSNHQIILVCYLPRHLSNKKPQVVPVHEFKCIEHEWFTRMQGMLLILRLKKQLFK